MAGPAGEDPAIVNLTSPDPASLEGGVPLKLGHCDSDAGRLNPCVLAAWIRLRTSRVRRNRTPPAAELLDLARLALKQACGGAIL